VLGTRFGYSGQPIVPRAVPSVPSNRQRIEMSSAAPSRAGPVHTSSHAAARSPLAYSRMYKTNAVLVGELFGGARIGANAGETPARDRRTRSETYRDGIFENAVDGIFQTTPDGRYLRANPALARVYGYDRVDDMIVAMSDIGQMLYVAPGRRGEFKTQIERDGAVKSFESQIRRRDGSVIWISETARTVRDAVDGQVLYYEGTVEDISARKALEARVQQDESLLRNIIEFGAGGVGNHRARRPAFVLEYRVRAPALDVHQGRHPYHRHAPGLSRSRAARAHHGGAARVTAPSAAKSSKRIPKRRGRSSASPRWSASPFEGQPASLSWVIDISDRKQAEALVEQKEAQLRAILEASPIGVMIADKRGQHMFSNARWRELGRVPEDKVEGLDVRVFFQSDEERRHVARLLHESGHVRDLEIEVKCLDGTPLWLLLTMERITFEGEPATLSLYYDYSERRARGGRGAPRPREGGSRDASQVDLPGDDEPRDKNPP